MYRLYKQIFVVSYRRPLSAHPYEVSPTFLYISIEKCTDPTNLYGGFSVPGALANNNNKTHENEKKGGESFSPRGAFSESGGRV